MADFIEERRKVADACRLLVDRGFFAGTGGNIGLRVADGFFALIERRARVEHICRAG